MPRVKLRSFGKFLGAYLLLCAAVTIISFVSCDYMKSRSLDYYDRADSVATIDYVQSQLNPSVVSITDARLLQNKMNEEYNMYETFKAMPEETLTNVVGVLLKKNTALTIKDIVEEYRANSKVYDNLPTKSESPKDLNIHIPKSTAMEKQYTPARGTVSYRKEVDTIDGKPVQVTIKEERTYNEQ